MNKTAISFDLWHENNKVAMRGNGWKPGTRRDAFE
jgi:hypothetical protein